MEQDQIGDLSFVTVVLLKFWRITLLIDLVLSFTHGQWNRVNEEGRFANGGGQYSMIDETSPLLQSLQC